MLLGRKVRSWQSCKFLEVAEFRWFSLLSMIRKCLRSHRARLVHTPAISSSRKSSGNSITHSVVENVSQQIRIGSCGISGAELFSSCPRLHVTVRENDCTSYRGQPVYMTTSIYDVFRNFRKFPPPNQYI